MVINTKENGKKNFGKEKYVMNTIKIFNTSAISPRSNQWETFNWKNIISYVKKLRQRIFRAEQLGQKRKVRKLQRLMLRSKANLLVSIKRITQVNKGKKTSGIDKYIATTSKERVSLFNIISKYNVNQAKITPVKRVYIPKKNNSKKSRPLGIPTIKDRIYQNIVKNALEPQWEARFESTMYGFRPKRSTIDAINHLFTKLRAGTTREWVFEADFRGCFDNLSHDHIMECIKGFPAKEIIYRWLKAGYIDNEVFNDTDFGTPQGGVISPLLANIALNGMENEVGIEYCKSRDNYCLKKNSVGTVKFADDFVILCHSRDEAESMYNRLEMYLVKRNLTLAIEKTRVVNIKDGFDFLGFNLKQYEAKDGFKLLIKPSKESIKKAKEKIKSVFQTMRGMPAGELIMVLNPIIRGIGNYWSSQVSKEIFNKMDNYVRLKIAKHIKHLHPDKSWKWKSVKYFKYDHTGASRDKNIFTDPKDNTNQLIKMKWIPISRHVPIKYKNSPDDPLLEEYFIKRDEKEFCRFNVMSKRKVAKRSNYKCRVCNQSLVGDEELIINNIIPKKLDGTDIYPNLELLHKSCHKQHKDLVIKYGGGKDFTKIKEFIIKNSIEPSSSEGINLIKKQFKKFKYKVV